MAILTAPVFVLWQCQFQAGKTRRATLSFLKYNAVELKLLGTTLPIHDEEEAPNLN